MMKTRTERLLAAALLGSVLGASGCSSTTAQSAPTTPAADGEKASCKGQHGCNGQGTPGESAGGENTGGDKTGEKHSCSGGTPGSASGFGGGL